MARRIKINPVQYLISIDCQVRRFAQCGAQAWGQLRASQFTRSLLRSTLTWFQTSQNFFQSISQLVSDLECQEKLFDYKYSMTLSIGVGLGNPYGSFGRLKSLVWSLILGKPFAVGYISVWPSVIWWNFVPLFSYLKPVLCETSKQKALVENLSLSRIFFEIFVLFSLVNPVEDVGNRPNHLNFSIPFAFVRTA